MVRSFKIFLHTKGIMPLKTKEILRKGFGQLADESFGIQSGNRTRGFLLVCVFYDSRSVSFSELRTVISKAFARENFEEYEFSEAGVFYFVAFLSQGNVLVFFPYSFENAS